METLDAIAHRYGVLPSQVLGIENSFQAFAVDLWAHNWGVQRENLAVKKAQWSRRG